MSTRGAIAWVEYCNARLASRDPGESIDRLIGNTPLVRLQRLPGPRAAQRGNIILAKLESHNPGGSAKDRSALAMIRGAEERGQIRPGDHLIEATSGSAGISMAMMAAVKGYRITLVMPDDMSAERRASMTAYGAQLILTRADVKRGGLEYARDLARAMHARGEGYLLDQFNNPDNSSAHYTTTGPEIWRDTGGRVTHFVSGMGTTGTIVGVSRFLKDKKASVQSIGVLPADDARIAGIRDWSDEYMPKIFDATRVDRLDRVTQSEAESLTRRLAREEGILGGISAGAAAAAALRIAAQVENAIIVFVVCDRGDRYLSTGVFSAPEEHGTRLASREMTRVAVLPARSAAVASAQMA
jgi:cysteine synthase B